MYCRNSKLPDCNNPSNSGRLAQLYSSSSVANRSLKSATQHRWKETHFLKTIATMTTHFYSPGLALAKPRRDRLLNSKSEEDSAWTKNSIRFNDPPRFMSYEPSYETKFRCVKTHIGAFFFNGQLPWQQPCIVSCCFFLLGQSVNVFSYCCLSA